MGLAGAQQLAKLQRTRTFTGPDFVADPIVNPQSLVAKLSAAQDPSTLALRSTLPAKVRKMLFGEAVGDLGTALALAKALNKLAKGPSLYNPERFPDQILSPKTLALKDQRLKGTRLAQFNRMLLCDAFPQEISTEPKTETIWLVTSLEPEKLRAEDFLLKNRQYWGIENGAHQRLDCSALEDRLRLRESFDSFGYLFFLKLPWVRQDRLGKPRLAKDLSAAKPDRTLVKIRILSKPNLPFLLETKSPFPTELP